MAFKGRQEGPIDFANLQTTLVRSKLQQTNNTLYQVISQLIAKISQFQDHNDSVIQNITGDIDVDTDTNLSGILATISTLSGILQDATFITKDDEILNLLASVQILAGTGITLDYSVANKLTISSAGVGACYIPMVTGNEPPDLMSMGDGSLLLVPYNP